MRSGRYWIRAGILPALFAFSSCYPSGPSDVTDQFHELMSFQYVGFNVGIAFGAYQL